MFVLRYAFQFDYGTEFVDVYQQLIAFRDKHPERPMRVYNSITDTSKQILWDVEFDNVEEPARWLTNRYGALDDEIRALGWLYPRQTTALRTRHLWRLAD